MREFLSRDLEDAEAEAWFGRHAAHYEAAWALFPDVLPVLDLLATTTGTGSCPMPTPTTSTAS